GITSRWRSIQRPDSTIRLKNASQNGFFFVYMFIKPRNGSRKMNVNTVNASVRHGASNRRNTQPVSSGRFAYQIGRYWAQNSYTQKILNAKISLPVSQKCFVVMYDSS